jgi:hypothetical protein
MKKIALRICCLLVGLSLMFVGVGCSDECDDSDDCDEDEYCQPRPRRNTCESL